MLYDTPKSPWSILKNVDDEALENRFIEPIVGLELCDLIGRHLFLVVNGDPGMNESIRKRTNRMISSVITEITSLFATYFFIYLTSSPLTNGAASRRMVDLRLV